MTDVSAGREEGRRQTYLAALGSPLWSSRHDLPGALPSAGLEFVAYTDATLLAEPVVPSLPPQNLVEQKTAVQNGAVQNVAEQKPAPVASPSVIAAPSIKPAPSAPVSEAVPIAPAANASTESYPRFACRVQLLAPGLMAVIALDDVPDLSAQEYRLLENLMQAVGGDITADAGREHFRWPMSPNPAIPRDAGAAREALAAFLGRRRMSPDEKTRWLVLGETLSVYVRTALPQHTVIAAPPLRELLDNPTAKRALWQALNG